MSAKAETPQKEKQPKPARKTPSFTFFLLLLTWAALGSVAAYFYHVSGGMPLALLKNVAESGNVSIDIAAMNERITTLEQQVETLESVAHTVDAHTPTQPPSSTDESNTTTPPEESPATPEVTPETIAPSSDAVNAAQHTPAMIAENMQLKAKLLALESALSQAQQQQASEKALNQHATLLLAATDLQQAINAHQPYHKELSTLRQLSGGDNRFFEAIDALALMAQTGIPTAEKIETSFENSFESTVNALRQAKENPTLFEKLTARFPSVISIRKTANAESASGETDIETQVAQAESLMLNGNYGEAMNKIEAIDNDIVQRQFQDWLNLADTHQQALYYAEKLVDLSRALVQNSTGDDA